KSRFLVGTNGSGVGWIGIGDDTRRAVPQPVVDEGANERRSMAALDHRGLTDELVDAAGTGWMHAKSRIPGGQVVALQVGEITARRRDDELVHRRPLEITADQIKLLGLIAPPLHHMRLRQPAP